MDGLDRLVGGGDIEKAVAHFDHNSVPGLVAIFGGSTGIATSIVYLAKKFVDLRFDLWKHRLEQGKPPEEPVILYDAYDRLLKK